ncbi:MAG: hypothetical protein MJZ30_11600 [Paludibacteraceae bacterium]|nr:hypothetical protein [Paludibacteraceae bacterium]
MQNEKHLFYSFIVFGESYSGKFVIDKRFTENKSIEPSIDKWTHRILLKNGMIAVIELETIKKTCRRKVRSIPSLSIFDASLTRLLFTETLHWRIDIAPFDHKFGSFYELKMAVERMASNSYMSMCSDDSGITFTNYDYDGYADEAEAWKACKKDKHELAMLKAYLRESLGINAKRVCYNGCWKDGVFLNIDFSDNLHLIAS